VSTSWFDTATVYQIYVRSFCDGDGDGVGDLAGVISQADRLASLGIDAVWLTPCFPSPQQDHGYDVADYTGIHHEYGTLETFDRMVTTLAERGIRTLLDLVPNHCSVQHPWFQAALHAPPGSPERGRFYFRDGSGPGGDLPPNNWLSVFGGPAWTRIVEADGRPGQWYLHMFAPGQPDWNWSCPDVPAMFDQVLEFWLDRGVSGFRVDAIAFVGKADGLPDMPPAPAGRDTDIWKHNDQVLFRPEAHEHWRRWRRTLQRWQSENPDREQALLVCEAYSPRQPEKLLPFLAGDQFHQAFSFDLLLDPWSAGAWRATVTRELAVLGEAGVALVWTLNNHDVQRAVTRYGRADATDAYTGNNMVYSDSPVDEALGRTRARAAIMFAAALPGALYLYQGEELGLPEVLDLADSDRQDPIFFRTGGVEKGRDGCRVPLPYQSDPADNFGFSHTPAHHPSWLPQPSTWGQWAPDAGGAQTLHLYQQILRLRRGMCGPLRWQDAPEGALAFRRGATVVVLNMSDTRLALPPALLGRQVLLSSSPSAPEGEVGATVAANTCLYLSVP
jgi:alpha-glucosidase